jgi:pyruvate dehydrogenase E1 component alpha subunit
LEAGVGESEILEIEAQVNAEVDEATEAAKAGGVPGEDLLMKDVWADGSASWRN